MRELTSKQAAVLEYIQQHHREHGIPPTLREIGKRFGIRSTNGVNDHLRALERKGYLQRRDGLARSLRVTGEAGQPASVDEVLREETVALRSLLRQMVSAAKRLPQLTPEMARLLGDALEMIGVNA